MPLAVTYTRREVPRAIKSWAMGKPQCPAEPAIHSNDKKLAARRKLVGLQEAVLCLTKLVVVAFLLD